jgi:hypothetical protein
VAGYITARPNAVSKITAASLTHHGFAPAPIIHTSPPADLDFRRVSKVEVLEMILRQTPNLSQPVVFLDDHPHTIGEISQQIEPRHCTPILVQGLRSQSREANERPILALTHQQIYELIYDRYNN